MSTIPTIFNESPAPYTVVGGLKRSGETGLGAILLNRGGRYLRRTVFQDLAKVGFDLVVSIEGPRDAWDIEELSPRFPFVKFLILRQAATIGEQINLAAAEIQSDRFLVLWNDQHLAQGGSAARIAERLRDSTALCVAPTLQNAKFETLPSLKAPAFFRNSVKTLPFLPSREGAATLYPFDAVGLYSRDRFIRLGGYDPTIRSQFWQLLDFGFRAQLWGEAIKTTQLVKVAYDAEPPTEDSSLDEFYKIFYLKNLAPVFRGDSAHIPYRRFPSYLRRAGVGPLEAWREFQAGRDWVETNRFRFACDARKVTELWETPEA